MKYKKKEEKKSEVKNEILLNKVNTYNNYFLAVGRLTKQKNYQYLISEFTNYLKIRKDAVLLIIGDGEERNKLLKLIKTSNASNNIFILLIISLLQSALKLLYSVKISASGLSVKIFSFKYLLISSSLKLNT